MRDDDLLRVRIMNERGVDLPLWPADVDDDVDDLPISDELRSDLMSLTARWAANLDMSVFEDRWVGTPIMEQLDRARYALDRWLHPARQRAARREAREIDRLREQLAVRVGQELGPRYRVTYVR